MLGKDLSGTSKDKAEDLVIESIQNEAKKEHWK